MNSVTVEQLESHLGERLTAKEILALFGFSENTYICDTILYTRGWLKEDRSFLPFLYEIVRGKDFKDKRFPRSVDGKSKETDLRKELANWIDRDVIADAIIEHAGDLHGRGHISEVNLAECKQIWLAQLQILFV